MSIPPLLLILIALVVLKVFLDLYDTFTQQRLRRRVTIIEMEAEQERERNQ